MINRDAGCLARIHANQRRAGAIFNNPPEPITPVPLVDLAIVPSGLGLWALDQKGRMYSLGGTPVFNDPAEPVHTRS